MIKASDEPNIDIQYYCGDFEESRILSKLALVLLMFHFR